MWLCREYTANPDKGVCVCPMHVCARVGTCRVPVQAAHRENLTLISKLNDQRKTVAVCNEKYQKLAKRDLNIQEIEAARVKAKQEDDKYNGESVSTMYKAACPCRLLTPHLSFANARDDAKLGLHG